MKPWFRGFKGTVDDNWVAHGVFKGRTITELPPGKWTQDYKEFLDDLVESKTITGYTNDSTTDSVHFTIHGFEGNDEAFVQTFKLTKAIHATNMHLFHPKVGIKKYSSPEEILVDFIEIRLDYYKKRKEHQLANLSQRAFVLDEKARFVQQVVNGDLVVFKRSKTTIEDELSARKFTKMSGTFNHLLHIKTYQYSLEAIQELQDEARMARKELDALEKCSIVDLWKGDL
jgi:DNA topoisomerase-2